MENEKKVGLRQKAYCFLACVLTVLFVIWTGYWIVLLMIPIFIDIYVTKFVPWGTWKNSENKVTRKVLEWVDAIVFALVGVWFLNSFFFQNYQIPSSSLEKSLLVGDYLCVSKISYGGRSPMTLFSLPLTQHTIPGLDTKSYLEKPQLKYKRFAGTGKIERKDIVVFNYPSGDTVALNRQNEDYYMIVKREGRANVWANKARNGGIVYRPVDRRENYVKRCYGLPGETLRLQNDSVFIDDKFIQGSDNEQHFYVVQTDGSEISARVFEELGISEDDQRIVSLEDVSDSTFAVACKLKYKETAGKVFSQVNMTNAMKESLQKKGFVWSVVRESEYRKLEGGQKGYYMLNPVYPINYEQTYIPGNFPAIWIPKAGSTIHFDTDVARKAATYERCIKNYEGNEFVYRDGVVYINGEKVTSYTFQLDYYFMMGDNRDNSADSRSWGFVPEDHIVGKPLFVWMSIDPDKSGFSSIRWSRLFTGGNKK